MYGTVHWSNKKLKYKRLVECRYTACEAYGNVTSKGPLSDRKYLLSDKRLCSKQ